MSEPGRIYTVKAVAALSNTEVEQRVQINSAGFIHAMPISTAAKKIGCDAGELLHQLRNRQGMTHVVTRKGKHWYT